MTPRLVALTLTLLAILTWGCTSAVRYSVPVGGTNQTAREEPQTDTTNFRGYIPDDEVRVESEDDGPGVVKDDPTAIGLGATVDKSIMNRIISRYMGTPYEKGGSGKLGLDCSGFVYVVYRDYDGTRLPLSVQSLYRLDERVDYDNLSYGDLLFFRIDDRRVSHVGIYLENGRFAHASEARGVVIDDLSDEYFATRYAGARRAR